MATTFADHLLGPDTHANRPAASAVPSGTLYSCTDHDLIYQSDGSTWDTYATLGGGGGAFSELLDETVLASDASTLAVTGLAASHRELRITGRLRGTRSAGTAEGHLRFGDGAIDTGSNYSFRGIERSSGSAQTPGSASAAAIQFSGNSIPGGTAPAGQFSRVDLRVYEYTDATIVREVRTRNGGYINSDPRWFQGIGTWLNTADPIERVSVHPQDGNWLAGSYLRVYGIEPL